MNITKTPYHFKNNTIPYHYLRIHYTGPYSNAVQTTVRTYTQHNITQNQKKVIPDL